MTRGDGGKKVELQRSLIIILNLASFIYLLAVKYKWIEFTHAYWRVQTFTDSIAKRAIMARDSPESWYTIVLLSAFRRDIALNSSKNGCTFRPTPPFPATVQLLACWVASFGRRRLQTRSIKSYFTGVWSAQLDMGASQQELQVFHHPSLQKLVDGIKRVQCEAYRKERQPTTCLILLKVLTRFDQNGFRGVRFHAVFCLAFAAFLREGEFTYSAAELNVNPGEFQQWYFTQGSVISRIN